jgi:hypothetical protein
MYMRLLREVTSSISSKFGQLEHVSKSAITVGRAEQVCSVPQQELDAKLHITSHVLIGIRKWLLLLVALKKQSAMDVVKVPVGYILDSH